MRNSPHRLRATRAYAIAELVLAACASLSASAGQAQPAQAQGWRDRYVLAPQRSSVSFAVDAFSHSQIRMRFHRMDAQLEGTHEGLDAARVTVTIDAASIEARPRFLSPIMRGGGVLDVARYPEIRFVSTRFVRTGEGSGWLYGNLTIRGVTRPVTLAVTSNGAGGNPPNDGTLAFAAAGEASRREFGLSAWSAVVGDVVHMNIQVEFVRVP